MVREVGDQSGCQVISVAATSLSALISALVEHFSAHGFQTRGQVMQGIKHLEVALCHVSLLLVQEPLESMRSLLNYIDVCSMGP